MYRRFQCPFAVDTLPIGLSFIFTGTSLSPISMIPWKCVCRKGGVSYYADRCCLSTSVQKQPFTQMFLKIGVLKSFTMFTVKHLCQSLFLIKLQARSLKSCNSLKRGSSTGAFLWKIMMIYEACYLVLTCLLHYEWMIF